VFRNSTSTLDATHSMVSDSTDGSPTGLFYEDGRPTASMPSVARGSDRWLKLLPRADRVLHRRRGGALETVLQATEEQKKRNRAEEDVLRYRSKVKRLEHDTSAGSAWREVKEAGGPWKARP